MVDPAILVRKLSGRRLLLVGGAPSYTSPKNGSTPVRGCPNPGDIPATPETWALDRGPAGGKRWVFHPLDAGALLPAEGASIASSQDELLRVDGLDRGPAAPESVDQACVWRGAGWECTGGLQLGGGPTSRDQGGLAFGEGRYLLAGGSGENGLSLADFWFFTPPGAQ